MQMPNEKDSGAITEKKELIGAMTKLYSEELVKDLTEILDEDIASLADLEKAVSKVLKAYEKANSFVEFQESFQHLL